MTKQQLHVTAHEHALTLPCFPSCENCLAWSDDALAFAGGPNVYLMTRKLDAVDKLTWNKDSLRVDTFTQEEYTQPSPVTISDLSLGEEQPESVVVALAWSPPGLGLHCRAVLAVLTSNLLLSIWETNGLQRGWRRSCIVNHYLPVSDQNAALQAATPLSRRHLRIRSFAWSSPLLHTTQPKWGSHFLILVDDDNNLLFCKIGKRAKDDYGQWAVAVLSTIRLGPGPMLGQPDNKTASIQQSLIQHSTVRSANMGAWKISVNEISSKVEARAIISCQRFHSAVNSMLSFEVTVSADLLETEFSGQVSAILREIAFSASAEPGSQLRHMSDGPDISYQLGDKPEWKEALQPACNAYSRKNKLNELFRIRFCGYATSPCHEIEAACVTLHAQDIYEYTPQGSEKCHIIFRPLQTSAHTPQSEVDPETVALGKIISLMGNLIALRTLRWNDVDRRLLGAYQKLALSQSGSISGGEILNTSLHDFGNAKNGTPVANARGERTSVSLSEDCTMCDSAIEMTLPITSAICQTGHHFARCNLSLIPIQEPGISKRCSGCNRQYLDIAKLGPLESPSLAQELFDEFDICPYCKEKFQG